MDIRANKPVKHGPDHAPGGQDPIFPFVGDGAFYAWLPLTNIIINPPLVSAKPTIAAFSGEYLNIPAPGNDEHVTCLTFISFSVEIDDPTGATDTTAWTFRFAGDFLNNAQILGGDGKLTHTDPNSGALMVYDIDYSHSVAYSPGVDPDPSFAKPCGVRLTYPCTIATGDVFTGDVFGDTHLPLE